MKSRITRQLRELIDNIVGEKSRTSPEHRQTALDLSLAVMALVAAADGDIHDSEVLEVQELYSKHGGDLIDSATVRKAFDIVATDQASTWWQLGEASALSGSLREDVFMAALRMARADTDLHDDESSLLIRIGKALGLPQNRIEDMCGGELQTQ